MKQMKKILACALALALVLSMPTAASASDPTSPTITHTSTDKTGNTEVFYTVTPGYTVTIPASVTVDDDPVTVEAADVKVPKGKQVVVKLTGINVTDANPTGDSQFLIRTTEGAELEYKVTIGGAEVAKEGVVLTVDPTDGPIGSADLTFELKSAVTYAGEYKGTVTFTVSVEDVAPAVTP